MGGGGVLKLHGRRDILFSLIFYLICNFQKKITNVDKMSKAINAYKKLAIILSDSSPNSMDNDSGIPIGISPENWLKRCIKKSCHNLHILSAEYKHIQERLVGKKKKTKRLRKKTTLSKQTSNIQPEDDTTQTAFDYPNTEQQLVEHSDILQRAFDYSGLSQLDFTVLEEFDTTLF